jgi:hypothetical protein
MSAMEEDLSRKRKAPEEAEEGEVKTEVKTEEGEWRSPTEAKG